MNDTCRHPAVARTKSRYLRIAFSAACGTVCLLLIALWVRSYYALIYAIGPLSSASLLHVASLNGQFILSSMPRLEFSISLHGSIWTIHSIPHDEFWGPDNPKLGITGIAWEFTKSEFTVWIAYWLPATILAAISSLPWLFWRFSLRTLLIGMTLAAAILGAVVWAVK